MNPVGTLRIRPSYVLSRHRRGRAVRRKLIDSHRKAVWDLQERVKELNCLYGISRLMQNESSSFDTLVLHIAELIRHSWQYPEIACARVILSGREYRTTNFREIGQFQSSPIIVLGERLGEVQIRYLEPRPASDEGPFLKEERHLIDAIAEQLSRIVTAKRSQERMKLLSSELVNAQEKERRRVARELHDNLAQHMIMLKLELADLGRSVAGAPSVSGEKLEGLASEVDRIICVIRDIAYDLMPPGLSELGLEVAIFRYCEDFSARRGLEVEFSSAGMERLDLDFEARINLFRIVQEALSNAVRHSESSSIRVMLTSSYPNILLRVEDDGRGFEVEKCLTESFAQKKMGLWGIHERARFLGGKTVIKSSPGKGTKILIEVPMPGCSKWMR